LINASRGAVVDQRALADALKNGAIAAAGLDVTTPEPIPNDDPLLSADIPRSKVVILPHIGSASLATRERMARIAAENLIRGLLSGSVAHQVK